MDELDGHLIKTGGDGRLNAMHPNDVQSAVNSAVDVGRVVLHFHGGLINESSGTQIARNLLPVYSAADAYPLFFVWRSGALDTIRGNIGEIFREELFDRLVRRVLKWAVGGVRDDGSGRGASKPDVDEMTDELGRRAVPVDGMVSEPFAEVAATTPGSTTLSAADEADFVAEVQSDDGIRASLAAALASEDLAINADDGGRGVPDVIPAATRMDRDVLTEISDGEVDGARGLISTVALARKALGALRAVFRRFDDQTDHGVYTTVVEEVLRVFYLGNVGGALWNAMKKDTLDTFEVVEPGRGGALVLDRLAERLAAGARPKITLVGHSTGAVFIDNFLTEVAAGAREGIRPWPAEVKFQVIFLAPACTTAHFAAAIDAAGDRVERFRIFTMSDEAERADRLVGPLYPRSLLYLVSGLLERDRNASALAPVLGMSRYLGAADSLARLLASPLAQAAALARVREYLPTGDDHTVLSPTAADAVEGKRSTAVSHTAFDDDEFVRASLTHLVGSW